jgi:hypothetical protein
VRPRNEAARDRLSALLQRGAPVSAATLAAELGVSGPTMHRMLRELGDAVVVGGKARRARYALRRPWRVSTGGLAQDVPVFEVDATGRAEQVAQLQPIRPAGCRMDLASSAWPVVDEARDGWWPGLPYPIVDMRPQGYMGRQLARAEHRTLGVGDNPDAWSDDELLHVLATVGGDLGGSLIVGERAFERWRASSLRPFPPLALEALPAAYQALAEAAVAGGVPGSSAAGEFPKFAARRDLDGAKTPHVLVKFSGAEGSATVRRWSDLLESEHVALACAREALDVAVASSRIVRHAGRTFLEVERFDRHGELGRSPLCSLGTLNAALLGDGSSDWTHLAQRLEGQGWLDAADKQRIERLWWYGRLIANSDMHLGNLSLRPVVRQLQQALTHGADVGRRTVATQGLEAAPLYDMLPMLYAPLAGGEVPPPREFTPPLPLPAQRRVWLVACAAALEFWRRASLVPSISEGFRAICRANRDRLDDAANHV